MLRCCMLLAAVSCAPAPAPQSDILSQHWLAARLRVCMRTADSACLLAHATLAYEESAARAALDRLGGYDPDRMWEECTNSGAHARCYADILTVVQSLTELDDPFFLSSAPECNTGGWECVLASFAFPPQTTSLASELRQCLHGASSFERAQECADAEDARLCMLTQTARNESLIGCDGYDATAQQRECFEWALDGVPVYEDWKEGVLPVEGCYLDVVATWHMADKLASSRRDEALASDLRRCLEGDSAAQGRVTAASKKLCVLDVVGRAMESIEASVEQCLTKSRGTTHYSLSLCSDAALRDWERYGKVGRPSPLPGLLARCARSTTGEFRHGGSMRAQRLQVVLAWASAGLRKLPDCASLSRDAGTVGRETRVRTPALATAIDSLTLLPSLPSLLLDLANWVGCLRSVENGVRNE